MKFKRQDGGRKTRASVDLTPLIDVVFQLLIFFMLSATFVVQASIQIEMPQARGAQTFEQRDMTITLAHGSGGPGNRGPIYVDDVPVQSMEELSRVLAERRSEQPDVRLLFRGDARLEHGRFVEVLGIANSLGITRYGIAAQPTGEEED